MAGVSTPEFWTDLYARGGDGWELRQPAPALVEFVERTPPAPGRIAVPGCGRGHDVRYLARHGHAAVGFDFSPAAIAAARALADADGVPAGSSRGDFDSSAPIGHGPCNSGRARSGPSSSARPTRPRERRTGRRVLTYGRRWQERDA